MKPILNKISKFKESSVKEVVQVHNLPIQFHVSFDKFIRKHSSDEGEITRSLSDSFNQTDVLLKKFALLADGFNDLSILEIHQKEIDKLLTSLFPEVLSATEMKAAGLPFLFHCFKYTSLFESVLKQAGTGNHLDMSHVGSDELYIRACVMILNLYYGYDLDFKHSLQIKIPDERTDTLKNLRIIINNDFSEIQPTRYAPEITGRDYERLLNHLDDVEIWKEKFPSGSYIFKGFSLITLYDVTEEQNLMVLHERLLKNKDDKIETIEYSLRKYLAIPDLRVGYSVFNMVYRNKSGSGLETKQSLFLDEPEISYRKFFSPEIVNTVFGEKKMFTVPDMNNTRHLESAFYRVASGKKIQSLILIPVSLNSGNQLVLIELASEKPYHLNMFVLHRLEHIRPVLEASVERIVRRFETQVDLTIQKECTSIHSSVKWKFRQAAVNFLKNKQSGIRQAGFEKIIFENVYPLYGQTDVKSSSQERNLANSKDLGLQLKMVKEILEGIEEPDIQTRQVRYLKDITIFLKELEQEFRVDTEAQIIKYLTEKIDPEFRQLLLKDASKAHDIKKYYKSLDAQLGTVYHYRKNYDNTISIINKRMANLLDYRQIEAQQIYPHFFERYKTDGVEHNMYIGASITGQQQFDKKYLQNLRLWQIQLICHTENDFYSNKHNYPLLLKIASLVFVYNKPITIRFMNDENHFDVDGTYNAHFEVLKKRIDKANVKGTDKRVTEPGFISIIYSDEEDEKEYMGYIQFLQSKNVLNDKVEMLELEDLQGVMGLKALKAGIVMNAVENDDFNRKYYYYDK